MPGRRIEPFITPANRSSDRRDAPVKDDPLQTADLHEEPTADLIDAAEIPAPAPAPSPNWAKQSRETRMDAAGAVAAPSSQKQPEASVGQAQDSRPHPSRPPAALTNAATAELATGSILCERYLLERIIGTGGTSVVWRARDLQWQGPAAGSATVAIKMLRPKAARNAQSTARLRHEFQCAKKLSHPNILRVRDLQFANDSSFITMELSEGRLLSTLLRNRESLRESLVRKILQGCADALIHAHSRGVVHGDFKPGNIFVTADGNVTVFDFGAAVTSPDVVQRDAAATDPARVASATPAYASPEVLEGQLPERRDDVFSFACVAYELLALQHPFEHGRSTQARDEGWIPPRAWSLSAPQWLALLAALSWQREQRTVEIGTLLTALLMQRPEVADPPLVTNSGTNSGANHGADSELRPAPGVRVEKKPLSDDFMRGDRGWRYFVIALVALILVLIALR